MQPVYLYLTCAQSLCKNFLSVIREQAEEVIAPLYLLSRGEDYSFCWSCCLQAQPLTIQAGYFKMGLLFPGILEFACDLSWQG